MIYEIEPPQSSLQSSRVLGFLGVPRVRFSWSDFDCAFTPPQTEPDILGKQIRL